MRNKLFLGIIASLVFLSLAGYASAQVSNVSGPLPWRILNTAISSFPASSSVGVGTTSPNSKFTVQGTSGSTRDILNVASSTGASLFKVAYDGTVTIPGSFAFGTGLTGLAYLTNGVVSATGTPQLTVGNLLATSTTATSTFNGYLQVDKSAQIGIANQTSTTTIASDLVVGANPTSYSASNVPLLQVLGNNGSNNTAGIIVSNTASTINITSTTTTSNGSVVIRSFGVGGVTNLDTADSNSRSRMSIAGTARIDCTSVSCTHANSQTIFTPAISSTAANTKFLFTGGADTSLTAGTEAHDVYFNMGQTRTHLTGTTIAAQRDFRLSPTTHAFSAYDLANNVLTDAATLSIDGAPIAGTNARVSTSTSLLIRNTTALNASTTNAYGLAVMAPSGATNNYAAIFQGGNVGIGTSSPSSLLSVGGNVQIDGTTSVGTGASRFYMGSDSADSYTYKLATDSAFANSYLNITTTGRVGIGTTTPNWLTQIAGTRPFLTLSDTNAGANQKHWTMSSQGGKFYFATSSDALATSTTPTLTLFNTGVTGGSVGIRRDSQFNNPTVDDALTVNGSVGINNTLRLYKSSDLTTYSSIKYNPSTSKVDTTWGWDFDNGGVSIGTPFVSSAIPSGGLIVSGNTGIGTSTIDAKLAVHVKSTDTVTNALVVASSTASATTTHFTISNAGAIYAPNTTASAATQTGYWCYDANGQFIRDTTSCLVSALKFKTGIETLKLGLDAVMKMKPVTYFKKTPLSKEDSGQQIGFIADWSENIVPQLVNHDSNGDVHSFNYEQYTAVLTKAIQEQQEQINALKARIDVLEKK